MLLSLFGGSDLPLGVALIYSLLGMGIVFLVLAFLILVITVMAKIAGKKNQEVPVTAEAPAVPSAPATPTVKEVAKGSCGGVNLFDVDDRTAAMLMAIVADKIEKPLNELRFISIKEIEE